MWSALTLVTAFSELPVTVAEAKVQCRVDYADDDVLIEQLIRTAAAMIDGPDGIGHCITPQTWKLTLDCWQSPIVIPLGPVASVTNIKYLDSDGVEQTLDSALYRFVTGVRPAFIERAYGASWPAHRAVSAPIAVTFVAGVAAANVDAGLKHLVLLLVGHLYQNREATDEAGMSDEIALSARHLIERFRVGRFA